VREWKEKHHADVINPNRFPYYVLIAGSPVAPHLIVERAERPTQRLIWGNSRGFRPTFAPHSGPKRALRTTFRATTV
jgi:hypothetical protein